MFFSVGTTTPDPEFGYIIAKHPDTIYARQVKSGTVHGAYSNDKTSFVASFQNDPLTFLNTVRDRNLSNYVHVQLGGVCPFNLTAFNEVFRSCMNGSFKGIEHEKAIAPKDLIATVGPFPINEQWGLDVFNSFGLKTTVQEKGEETVVYQLEATTSVTEFTQKIYLLSYYLTINYDFNKQHVDKIEKFARMCEGWIQQCQDDVVRNKFIKKICKYNKEFLDKFTTRISSSEEEKELLEDDLRINRVSLHEKKHNLIVEKLENIFEDSENMKIIDYGCGEGKLIKKINKSFKSAKVLGMEANEHRAYKLKKMTPNSVKVLNQNILLPNISHEWLTPDVLIHCEVIEHLHANDRTRALKIMRDVLQPDIIIITTPNSEYNVNFGFEEGQMRHRDHKIEYTEAEFDAEVCDYLKSKYDIKKIPVIDYDNPDDFDSDLISKTQPSFVIICTRTCEEEMDHGMFTKIKNMHHSQYLDISGYELRPRDFENGYASPQYMNNHKNIFFMAPTIPPVEYDPQHGKFLEHPLSAINYYRQRDVHDFVVEHKYMGSRASMIIFKKREHALAMGFEHPVTIISRNGFPYFREEEQHQWCEAIYNEVESKLETDFIILDAEGMPWSFKGKGLIQKQFRAPGECALLTRSQGGDPQLKENAEKFLSTLDNYSKNEDVYFRIFQVLAKGTVKTGRDGRASFKNWISGFNIPHSKKYETIRKLEGDLLKPTEYFLYECSVSDPNVLVEKWENYCAEGGEGFIIKPMNFINYQTNGYLTQPMLKVRGADYLRIIYGMDYLEDEYFNKVSHRRIGKKRIVAIQEFELSMKILRAFLQGQHDIKNRLVSGFIGMENWVKQNYDIDATL